MAEDGQLQLKAKRYLEDLRGSVASEADLRAMAKATSLDAAAMLYYESLTHSRRDAEFVRVLNSVKPAAVSADERAAHATTEILIVPSVFRLVSAWKTLGSEPTEQLRARLRAHGFKTDVVMTTPSATLEENARAIGQAVIASPAANVILLSRDRGSLEVRLLFHVLASGGFDLSKISGWISVSAPINGVRSFDQDFFGESVFGPGRNLSRLKLEANARLNGESLEALRAAARSQSVWSEKLALPERVSLVQIVGVPRRDHLLGHLRSRFDAMKELGPSDGLQLLSEAHVDAGLVVPVWGLAPTAPWNAASALIERSCLMIADLPRETAQAERSREYASEI